MHFLFSGTKKCPVIGALFGPQFRRNTFLLWVPIARFCLEPWRPIPNQGLTLREINSWARMALSWEAYWCWLRLLHWTHRSVRVWRVTKAKGSLLITWATGSRDERGEWDEVGLYSVYG